jgi:hypothetical protein
MLTRGLSGRLVVLFAATLVVCLATATATWASHPRPKSGSPLTVKMVPAFEECLGSANATHGAPLALPACDPPIQSSTYLTLDAPDRAAPFNTAANGTGSVIFKVTCLSSTPPPVENGDTPPCSANAGDQEDVKLTIAAGDVRCVGVGGQLNCAGGAASLYNGKILLDIPMRLTDHFNATTGQACAGTTTCVATVTTSSLLPLGSQCTSGNCGVATSADASVPGFVQELKRAVLEFGEVQFQDAGLNGNLVGAPAPSTGTCPPACAQDDAATVFMTQGLFAP